MKLRKGYSIIELLIVITAISLIMGISYQGVNILIDNIKVAGVKNEISRAKTAIAKAQAIGNVYWGGDFTGSTRDLMKEITPMEDAEIGSCKYFDVSLDDSAPYCEYDNIIAAEKTLYEQMKEMEFPYSNGTFRSKKFPTVSIGFTHNMNGYSGIVFSDLPGNIARKVYEDLNSPTWDPTEDGLSSSRPILIFDANAATGDTTSLPDSTTGFQTLLTEISGIDSLTSDEILDKIGNLPKVTLIYMYTFQNKSW